MSKIEEFNVGKLKVEIHVDEDHGMTIEDVISFNEMGSPVIIASHFHRSSVLKQVNPFQTSPEATKYASENGYAIYSLWRYEHGGVSLQAYPVGSERGYPFTCQWDAGLEGYVLVDPKQVNADPLKFANDYLRGITEWMNGEIYGFKIFDEEGDEVDSCWGITGFAWAKEYATDNAVAVGERLVKEQGEQLCMNL